MSATYGKIGRIYADCRRLDPRIGQLINHALGDAQSVVNVGAGAGSYEPKGRSVAAVEQSVEMIRQRPASAAPVVQGRAEDLPFEDGSFDAAFAALTIHHWSDKSRGCAEMRRLAKEMIVRFTFDPEHKASWLPDDFPEFAEQDDVRFPKLSEYEGWSRPIEVTTIPIRHDCPRRFP